MSMREIAEAMGIKVSSLGTAKTHLRMRFGGAALVDICRMAAAGEEPPVLLCKPRLDQSSAASVDEVLPRDRSEEPA
jgi:hypothetical protein